MTVLETPERQNDSIDDSRRPRWARPGLCALLTGTAVLYLWGLGKAGWANEYYAAAAQAGTQNWKALLFGSLDAANAITVDKPPAALWVMGLSGRLFGFSAWSMLVPQALMGVASVALVYGAVRRVSGYVAGLLAGAVLALTPVAALMFRFNNPDALLVLLLVVAGYCVIRSLEAAPARWIGLAGLALGGAFLTKLMQALLVAPALAAVVLVALPGGVWHRVRMLAVGLGAFVVSAGSFIALVSLWPSDSRPYIGGSTDNSLLQLAIGYNGLGRVFGGSGNHVGPPPGTGPGMPGPPGGPGMFGGDTGIARLFAGAMGTEISWLLPAALIALAAGLWFTRRSPHTDRTRAALLLWGGWLLVTAMVFSFMKGIMHPYYTVALAPALAAILGTCAPELWNRRDIRSARRVLATMLAITAAWTFVLLQRTPEWLPWLRWVLLVGGVACATAVVTGPRRLSRHALVLVAAALLFGLGGTAAYTVTTVAGAHGGPIPTSGPHRSDADLPGGPKGFPGPRLADNAELIAMIADTENLWAAATVGAHGAASLELATGRPVIAIGGFSGADPAPTLEQFQSYVAQGQIHYFVADTGPGLHHGPEAESSAGKHITEWVQRDFTARTVGGVQVFDLTGNRR